MRTVTQSKSHKKVNLHPEPDWWQRNIPDENVITIGWSGQHDYRWNEICADVVEVFGLPGGRFHYKPYPSHMKFTFKSIRDAELCRILLSEKI